MHINDNVLDVYNANWKPKGSQDSVNTVPHLSPWPTAEPGHLNGKSEVHVGERRSVTVRDLLRSEGHHQNNIPLPHSSRTIPLLYTTQAALPCGKRVWRMVRTNSISKQLNRPRDMVTRWSLVKETLQPISEVHLKMRWAITQAFTSVCFRVHVLA